MSTLLDHVLCPHCSAPLDARATVLTCSRCAQSYPRVGAIPVLLPQPDAHLEMWRRQLGLIIAQGQETREGLMALSDGSSSPSGQARLRALATAVGDQVDDIAALLGPALGGPLPRSTDGGLPRGVVEYIHYLYRDWAWADADSPENQRALEDIRAIAGTGPFGRTLVLGAGGCRLAYDVHRSCGASETAVVDIDPYLLVIAEAVVRGRSVRLTESTVNVQEVARASATWNLRAPAGPLDAEHFHFFLANGVEPPFDGGFDTIVTPWFIDRVPPDLTAFLATLRRLLVPGGRWINQGPLLYPAETSPHQRYAREEIFDLAERAGLRVGRWSGESRPYLVSPLTGRGKMEWVLTFEAVRSAG